MIAIKTKQDARIKGRSYSGKHSLKELLRGRRPERDEDGRVIINMIVHDDEEFLSEFSPRAVPVISSDVAEYLTESAKVALPSEKLTLRVHSDCVDELEDDIYPSAIKEYFVGQLIALGRELRRSAVIAFFMLLSGIIVLVGTYWFGNHFDAPMWFEVFDIVATVLIWEAVNIFAFQINSLWIEKRRCRSFISMKIEFYQLKH